MASTRNPYILSQEELDRYSVNFDTGEVWRTEDNYRGVIMQVTPNCRYWYLKHKRPDGVWINIYAHRIIAQKLGWYCEVVDHINGDGTDNRRDNLRPADKVLNALNTRRHRQKVLIENLLTPELEYA